MIHIEYLDFIMDIDSDDGMNISFLSWKGKTLIKTNEKRRNEGLTYGMAILFPTPNRTADNKFSYQDKNYSAKMHGLVRNLSFTVNENDLSFGTHKIIGELYWNKKYEDFYMYPFECKLQISIILEDDEICYSYEITNVSRLTMPYGFGIHPFFCNPEGDACIRLNTGKALTAINSLNTGAIYDTKETVADLSTLKVVKNLQLDTVYYFMPEENLIHVNNMYKEEKKQDQYMKRNDNRIKEKALIKWKDYQMSIQCSDDFSHMIVYTPNDKTCFCVEPQTCSIDVMNLLSKGYEEVSGIIKSQPNEVKYGIIYMKMSLN